MAQVKKSKTRSKKAPRAAETQNKTQNKTRSSGKSASNGPLSLVRGDQLDATKIWAEALELEEKLEVELLADAVLTARVALSELQAETHTRPFERRRGLRLREKAEKVERAFNRLRALRRGELLPERHPDD